MNKELLQNKEVKEIAEAFAKQFVFADEKEEILFWDDFVIKHTKPKEWEILQFRQHNDNTIIHKLAENGCYHSSHTESTLSRMLNYPNVYYIDAVKRLSDDCVIYDGDHVNVEYESGKTFTDTISHFTYTSGVDIIDVYFKGRTGAFDINSINIEKAKQLLFKTFDNKPVFEGDKFYTLDRNFERELHVAKNGKDFTTSVKTFSTIEAMREYILMNKPKLSINNILSFTFPESVDMDKLKNRLIELAKTIE